MLFSKYNIIQSSYFPRLISSISSKYFYIDNFIESLYE